MVVGDFIKWKEVFVLLNYSVYIVVDKICIDFCVNIEFYG